MTLVRYYFLQTSMQNRGGETKNTVRALPDQYFEDGTPVNTSYNVSAPKKDRNDSPNGNRDDYPIGTVFASTYLAENNSQGRPFYTVYPHPNAEVEFFPVSDDANFQFVSPQHKNANAIAAYIQFITTGDQEFEIEDEEGDLPPFKDAAKAYYTPADEQGLARAEDTNWTPRYTGQIEEDSQIFVKWLRGLFTSNGVKLKIMITMGNSIKTFEKLYRCGETLNTLASRRRFDAFLKEEKGSYEDYALSNNIKFSPLKNYLEWIEKEHDSRQKCTAVERDLSIDTEADETMSIICEAMSAATGLAFQPTAADKENIRKACNAGFTLDIILDPDNLSQATSVADYASKLASGAIALPECLEASGASFIEMLMSDKKNACPKDKEGFHVDNKVWKVLLDQLYKKRNTMIIGPSGTGKTEIIINLCERTGTPYTIIQMGSITDPGAELIGQKDLDSLNNGTVFEYADFALAIQRPGVIILDEINRIPKNGENVVFGCLDRTRMLSANSAKSSENRTIKVHPDCCFFATANIGVEFTGTKEIDAALNTRFPVKIRLDYLQPSDESKILMARTGIEKKDAENIAFTATSIRLMARKDEIESTISTRETLAAAELVADGFSALEAMEIVFLPLYDNDGTSTCECAKIKNIISQRFNNKKSA